MKLLLTRDRDEFAARARDVLERHIASNVLATVLLDVRRGPGGGEPLFAYGAEGDAVRFAAMRTPPWPLLISELDPVWAGELVERWRAADPGVPGVSGLTAGARAVAAAWARQTGGTTSCRMREAMHTLEVVSDPRRSTDGRLRPAENGERSLLIGWMSDFAREAGVQGGAAAAAVLVDTRLDRGHLFVWEDEEPRAMVGRAPAVAGVVRIGPVYTPIAHRRRGYATSAVAALSRRALGQDASRCMLFTDLANPTSNRIYAEVGYRRDADWEEHAFHAA